MWLGKLFIYDEMERNFHQNTSRHSINSRWQFHPLLITYENEVSLFHWSIIQCKHITLSVIIVNDNIGSSMFHRPVGFVYHASTIVYKSRQVSMSSFTAPAQKAAVLLVNLIVLCMPYHTCLNAVGGRYKILPKLSLIFFKGSIENDWFYL